MAIQASGSLLDACVLALLMKKDAYGYELTQGMKKTLGISESTLYPVVRRLQTEECLMTYDKPFNGRNRRYYQITKKGLETYQFAFEEWGGFKEKIDKILERGGENG